MANKKKIEARLEAERQARQRRMIQIAGGAIIVVLIALTAWLVFPLPDSQTACEPFADIPVAAQYSEPPMKIDQTKQYFATVKMAKGGEFMIQLYPDKAPITVNSFVFLACKGYFNGVTFHRVIDGFMAQGGDPTGTGGGGPGYSFEDEFGGSLTFDREGLLAMANSGPNTNGSQFFITYAPSPHLNNRHTIFGEVTSGMDVVNSLTRRDPSQNPDYPGDAIETITITEQ